MDQTTVEIIKILVMAAVAIIALLVRRDIIPFIQSKITTEQFQAAREMASTFVYMAHQQYKGKTGAEKKEIVTAALKKALDEAGIIISDNLISDMIEAAVKGLKIAEEGG